MGRSSRKYSVEELKLIAKQFTTRTDFNRKNRSAYEAAKSSGKYEEICQHMVGPNLREKKPSKWTKESISEVALRYTSRWDFGKHNKSAYDAARRYGWLEEVCAHMSASRFRQDGMTVDKALIESQKYQTMVAFKDNSPREYWFLYNSKLLPEVRKNMSLGYKAYDRNTSGSLYMLELKARWLDYPLYKIGITNGPVEKRVASLGLREGVSVSAISVVDFEDGQVAYDLERSIHANNYAIRHKGPRVTKRVINEIYTRIPQQFLNLEPFVGKIAA